MVDYSLELLRQYPINYKNLVIHPISLNMICETFGLNIFDRLMTPFCLTIECLNMPTEIVESVNIFSDVVLKDDFMLQSVAIVIKVFCGTKDVVLNKTGLLVTYETDESTNTFQIDKDNFNDISDILLKLTGKSKITVEKPPKKMSEKQRDVWEKLQAGRRKESSKNVLHIYDMLNVCEFGGKYHIPQSQLGKWTLWRILNCYKAITNMKTYDDSLKLCLVSGEGKNISGNNHWHHKLLIRD